MNYLFQTRGVTTADGLVFDYQRYDIPDIDELALDETLGLNAGAEWAGYKTRYYCADRTSFSDRQDTALAPIDWNCDGSISVVPIVGDINNSYLSTTVLQSQNNWDNLILHGGGVIGGGEINRRQRAFRTEPMVEEELTWEQHQILNP